SGGDARTRTKPGGLTRGAHGRDPSIDAARCCHTCQSTEVMVSTDGSHTEHGQIPLIFIHGAWLSARSWENYIDYFAKCGFAVSAPEWPRKQGDVEALRDTAEASAGLGVQEIVDHYEQLIRDLDQPPVLIGHSYGGLF